MLLFYGFLFKLLRDPVRVSSSLDLPFYSLGGRISVPLGLTRNKLSDSSKDRKAKAYSFPTSINLSKEYLKGSA